MDLSNAGADETRMSSDSRASDARLSPDSRHCVPSSPFVPSPSNVALSFGPQSATMSPAAPAKVFSKNANGTVVMTSAPNNDAELQLYRVMQRASLLTYYDTLLEMGGDDVQQLCDAGEEEFLEIMALVGMASKPLHVRRFQKSLQEWMIDPSPFQVPLAGSGGSGGIGGTGVDTTVCCTRRSILDTSHRPVYSPSPGILTANREAASGREVATSPGPSLSSRSSSPLDATSNAGQPAALLEAQVQRLKDAAERISKHLPQLEPKTHSAKKKVCKELEVLIAMPADDPRRMEGIRRYAAIYGRFDCKRRPEKPLTLHEASVNEAAAQMCHFVPALLTRRDELFPLARRVVRDAGFLYARGATPHLPTSQQPGGASGAQWCRRKSNDEDGDQDEEPPPKRAATTPDNNI